MQTSHPDGGDRSADRPQQSPLPRIAPSAALIEAASRRRRNRPLSLMILDIDHFKSRQRHLRPRCGRRGAQGVRRFGVKAVMVRRRSRLPAGRRGIHHRHAGHGARCRGRGRRAGAAGDRATPIFPSTRACAQISITVSIGIAERRNGREADVLMKRADLALYRSKNQRPQSGVGGRGLMDLGVGDGMPRHGLLDLDRDRTPGRVCLTLGEMM